LNKATIDGILGDFFTVTGMDVSLVNADFHTVSVYRNRDGGLCSFIQRDKRVRDTCRTSDIERLDEVKRSCEAVLYTCPCGIVEAIVPVIREGGVIAYLFCSMGIHEGEREAALSDILGISGELSPSELADAAERCPTLTDREISAHLSMLKMMAEHVARDPSPMVRDESIGKLVKYYVKNNLDRKITLSDIALSLHCSTVTLTEHFKAEFGITIMDYVMKKRMELSEKLLLSTDEPLRVVAALSGFSDVEYFSRSFKKYYGTSPAAWRKIKKEK
jgi:AraC-like DNA-binding protein